MWHSCRRVLWIARHQAAAQGQQGEQQEHQEDGGPTLLPRGTPFGSRAPGLDGLSTRSHPRTELCPLGCDVGVAVGAHPDSRQPSTKVPASSRHSMGDSLTGANTDGGAGVTT